MHYSNTRNSTPGSRTRIAGGLCQRTAEYLLCLRQRPEGDTVSSTNPCSSNPVIPVSQSWLDKYADGRNSYVVYNFSKGLRCREKVRQFSQTQTDSETGCSSLPVLVEIARTHARKYAHKYVRTHARTNAARAHADRQAGRQADKKKGCLCNMDD